MKSKTKDILLVFQSLIIVSMLIFYFFGLKGEGANLGQGELTLEEKYEKLEGKTIDEMTPEEWTIQNLYKIKKWEKEGAEFDTMSYEEALARNRKFKEDLARELDPCTEDKMINAFHEIMEFNMPNDIYEEDEIKWKQMGDCTLHINVYTKEPKYGWKTFWVFEVRYNTSTEQYEMQAVKKEFLG
jgi:hypothetical protein